jgi:exo-1,4-beta-D-glucosaminidase
VFSTALANRYGKSDNVEDFAFKSQLQTYEGVRAMYEAYSRNKYESTGVIQWMLNNAWPSMIWHLYDYYLRPAAATSAPSAPWKRCIPSTATTIIPSG